jgi:hypothetical protein
MVCPRRSGRDRFQGVGQFTIMLMFLDREPDEVHWRQRLTNAAHSRTLAILLRRAASIKGAPSSRRRRDVAWLPLTPTTRR